MKHGRGNRQEVPFSNLSRKLLIKLQTKQCLSDLHTVKLRSPTAKRQHFSQKMALKVSTLPTHDINRGCMHRNGM